MPFDVDVNAIDDRLRQLPLFHQATSYSKEKELVWRELENVHSSLPDSITVSTVTPRDIFRFLVHEDKNTKTKVQMSSPMERCTGKYYEQSLYILNSNLAWHT